MSMDMKLVWEELKKIKDEKARASIENAFDDQAKLSELCKNIGLDRLRELAEADRDRRCVIYKPRESKRLKPCTCGCKRISIWLTADGQIAKCNNCGKTAALGKSEVKARRNWNEMMTRPEAEAALASTKQVVASTVASEVHKPGGDSDA